jgi:hypothetical protein
VLRRKSPLVVALMRNIGTMPTRRMMAVNRKRPADVKQALLTCLGDRVLFVLEAEFARWAIRRQIRFAHF